MDKRLAFLSSGSGQLTRVVLRAIKDGYITKTKAMCLISDRDSQSINVAKEFGIESVVLDYQDFESREDFSDCILQRLENDRIDFCFLTFDRILSGKVIEVYKNRLINIHPSLLPAFPGYNSTHKAKRYGCKFIGATCHFIDKGIDVGPIINQGILPVDENFTESLILGLLYKLRQTLAVEAIYAFANELIKIQGRHVFVKGANYNSYPINPSLNLLK